MIYVVLFETAESQGAVRLVNQSFGCRPDELAKELARTVGARSSNPFQGFGYWTCDNPMLAMSRLFDAINRGNTDLTPDDVREATIQQAITSLSVMGASIEDLKPAG